MELSVPTPVLIELPEWLAICVEYITIWADDGYNPDNPDSPIICRMDEYVYTLYNRIILHIYIYIEGSFVFCNHIYIHPYTSYIHYTLIIALITPTGLLASYHV